ncbi:MAG: transglutaminase domain-containing protein [Deltaproteobacteria bacterium]|nr:transglutaminase domain-containing protein [Deltaproteobacteria bacterium]
MAFPRNLWMGVLLAACQDPRGAPTEPGPPPPDAPLPASTVAILGARPSALSLVGIFGAHPPAPSAERARALWSQHFGAIAPQLTLLASAIGGAAQTDLARARLISTWIYASIGAESLPRSGEEVCRGDTLCIDELTLEMMDGQCGYRAMLMIDVLAALGMHARRVNFFDIPAQIGHTAVEVQIDGLWRFFDPTFGIHFADPTSPNVPLSITEARRRYSDVVIQRSRAEPWRGTWADLSGLLDRDGAGGFDTIPPGAVEHPFIPGLMIADITQTYAVSTMGIEGTPTPYRQRIAIDLAHQPVGAFGAVDGRLDDLLGYAQSLSYGNSYTPFLFVVGTYAAALGPVVEDEFRFLTESPRDLRLTLTFTGRVLATERRYLLGRLHHAAVDYSVERHRIDFDWQDHSVTVSIRVLPPLSVLRLALEEEFGERRNFHLDAISWAGL